MGMTAQFKILKDADLRKLLDAPDETEDFLFSVDVEDPFEGQTDIDKSWHALHYLICGNLEPDGSILGDVILGGEPLGPDLGYGPARILDSEKVKAINKELQNVDIESAYKSLDRDSEELREIYLGFEFIPEEIDYLKDYFEDLKAMYSEAAKESKAVLAYLA